MGAINIAGRQRADILFRDHVTWLTRWAQRHAKNIASAEDVTSEVFLRLMSSVDLGDLHQPRAMMTTIARRVLYDLRRRNDLFRAYQMELAALPQAYVADPEEAAIAIEALRAIDLILAKLSPDARAAFLYSRIDRMKHKEIAERLGISIQRVRRSIAKGIEIVYLYQLENS